MLQISALTKHYNDETGLQHVALEGINLAVGEHEAVALVGTSGCGKTTLLRIVSGLERASAGRLTMRGDSVNGPRRDVGIVFQEPRLMPWLTVRENVRLALLDLPLAAQDSMIVDLLRDVGLADFGQALPRQLSGGMAQRVAIARALARKPSILLLDEPFSALDSFTRIKLQNHLGALWEKSRFTLILVTHDIDEALTLSDRIVVMRGQPGRIHRQLVVDLPRPRRRTAPEFQMIKEEVTLALEREAAVEKDVGPFDACRE
jgi:sulfonate transport system ATP-binding protein